MWKCGSGLFSFRKRWQPRHLDYIDKSHCSLTVVPDDVLRHERTLEELSLDANQIQDLPKGLFRMHKLRRLILSDNEIQDLPDELGNLSSLEELDISKNGKRILHKIKIKIKDQKSDFRIIPDAIEKCKKLTYLDVSSNSLGEVPDAITKLTELRNWVVNDIALGEIPPEVGSLTNLVVLELRDNCIKFLPMSFSFLSSLQRLDLGGNELEELPETIGQLSSLIELWLDNNILMNLPVELGELQNLQCLDVSENHIEELPEEIAGLVSLTDLIMTTNSIHELPEGIGNLKKLQILKVDNNQVDELTSEIGGCESLLELILTDNEIEFLPGSIGKLTKLSHFNIDKNRLFTLPPEIGKLTKLSVFSARDNEIASVPKEIGNCKSLTVLALSGNKLVHLPLTVSNLPLKALWLSQNQSQSVLKLQVEDDSNNEKVLTCFLFPQEALKPASLEDFINDIYDQEGDHRQWKSFDNSAVKFENAEEIPKESNLTRKGTPYPKELRDRHPHLIRKRSGSGEEGHDDRPGTPSDEINLKKRHSKNLEDIQIPVQPDGGIVNPLLADVDTPQTNATSKPATGVKFAKPSVGFAAIPDNDDVIANEEKGTSRDVDVKNQEGSDSEDGEKRVNFIITDDDKLHGETSYKWERKDTPHHLKGKRIVQGEDNEDVIKDILENIQKKKSEEKLDDLDKETTDGQEVEVPTGESNDDFVVINNSEETTAKGSTHKYTRRDTPRPADFKKEPFKPRKDASHIFAEEEEEEEDEEDEEDEDGSSSSEKDDEEGDEEVIEEIEQKTITKVYEEITTTLEREETSLGINIAGGLGTTSFDDDEEWASFGDLTQDFEIEEGVFISKITPDGPADVQNVLKVGDKIIKVNDDDISSATHDDAVKVLKEASSPVTVVVLREVTDEEQIAALTREEKNVRFAAEPEVEDIEIAAETIPVVLKRDGKGLGFSIAGGKGASVYKGVNTYKPPDEGIYISKLSENGPAALDKRLQVGDKLLSVTQTGKAIAIFPVSMSLLFVTFSRKKSTSQDVDVKNQINNVDVRNAKHEDVVKILTSCTDKVTIIAYRERVINKKMRPMSQINGDVKTVGESTKAEDIPDDVRGEDAKLLVEEVVLKKSSGPLGLSIVGGSDHASHPFGVNEPGIFVSKVNPTGEAAKTNLCVGDRILRVNEKDMRTASHHEAVAALISNDAEVQLLVRHDPPPPGIQEININKKIGEKLGISIRGGAKGHPGNPFDKDDEGIFVSKVNTSGAAARDARLKVGMRILEVNNTSLLGATHVDAVRALRTAGDNLSLIVCDGYDEDAAMALQQENVLFNPLLCEPARFSPDSQSSATSGDSYGDTLNERYSYHDNQVENGETTNNKEEDDFEIDEHGNKVKRTPSAAEQRAMDAEKRAKWRQERLAALDNDAKKAQVVIAQAKALSTSSLEGSNISDSDDRTPQEATS